MSNFWSRTITGLSMVFILLAAIAFSGWVFAAIFLAITLLGLWEFYGLVEKSDCLPQKHFGTIAGGLIYLSAMIVFLGLPGDGNSLQKVSYLPFMAPLPMIFAIFLFEIYRNKPLPLVNIALTVLGFLYIAVPFSLLVWFSRPGQVEVFGMPALLVGYFAFTWLNDTAAYLFGRQFGRHKFFERISPKKTWEGTIAGAVVTLGFAAGFTFLAPAIAPADWFVLASMVVFFGTHGDLAESLLKRSLNIKDSGTILPGHGGILDRFDTMLVSSPFVFLYFFLKSP